MSTQPQAIDPLDLIAFMAGGMTFTRDEMRARWPKWEASKEAALARYDRERTAQRIKWKLTYLEASSDLMVNSTQAAIYHWCYLPLMRQVLAEQAQPA